MKSAYKVIIGVPVTIFILIALGIWSLFGLRHSLYPPAPPMPAVVSESMPEILSRLETVLKTNAPNVLADLQPGLTDRQIAASETQYHVQLPDEIKAIYKWHNGSVNQTNRLTDFIPIHHFLALEETLEARALTAPEKAPFVQRTFYRIFAGHRDSWICLFDDGADNGYWFDLKRKPSEGAIFSNFTEEASYTFFPSAKNLMAGIAECYAQGAFHIKKGSSPPELEEDFEQSQKIWNQFGAGN